MTEDAIQLAKTDYLKAAKDIIRFSGSDYKATHNALNLELQKAINKHGFDWEHDAMEVQGNALPKIQEYFSEKNLKRNTETSTAMIAGIAFLTMLNTIGIAAILVSIWWL